MDRSYFNRYEYFEQNGQFKIVPGVEIPIKGTDKYYQYKRGKDRLDKLSQEFYDSPVFGWVIMLANPSCGVNEFEIPDNYVLRIPFPLVTTLQDYKSEIDRYRIYNGE